MATKVPKPTRRAFALLTTLLLVTLLIAVTAQLATGSSIKAIDSARRHRTLAHDLAAQSALHILTDRMSHESPLLAEFKRLGKTEVEFQVGEVVVSCRISNDAARLNPNMLQALDEADTLARALQLLRERYSLTGTVQLQPILNSNEVAIPYRWFDQIVTDTGPEASFRWDESANHYRVVWSDVVTFWGDSRLDLRHVDMDTLDVALRDIRSGLARPMLAMRKVNSGEGLLQSALERVPAEVRQRVAERVTLDERRYAIRLNTDLGGDRRRWFVVAHIDDGHLQVLHRTQVTW